MTSTSHLGADPGFNGALAHLHLGPITRAYKLVAGYDMSVIEGTTQDGEAQRVDSAAGHSIIVGSVGDVGAEAPAVRSVVGQVGRAQQAVQLGYLPRVRVFYTSATARDQVNAPTVNALLFIAVIGIVLGFRSSSALAVAFGLAVTATMVLTMLMVGFLVFRVWRWNAAWAGRLYALLLALDLGLFAASATKFLDGGWLPMTIAVILVLVFTTWQRGRAILTARLRAEAAPLDVFLRSLSKVQRVPATAVYLTSSRDGVPPALLHNLKYNLVLHRRVLFATV